LRCGFEPRSLLHTSIGDENYADRRTKEFKITAEPFGRLCATHKKNPSGLRRMDFLSDDAWSQRYLDCNVSALPEKLETSRFYPDDLPFVIQRGSGSPTKHGS
jgi:hypothetical protein